MKVKEIIGIDVGKESNEGCIHSSQKFLSFENNNKGFEKFVDWVSKNSGSEEEQLLFAFEHTGLYSFPLAEFLTERNCDFVLLPGLELKRSMGIIRGKNDKIDAKRIAQYTYEKRDSIKPYIMPQEAIVQLKRLLTLRERLVKQCAGYKASLCEYKHFLKKKDNLTLFETQEQMIKYQSKQIEKIDNELSTIIKKSDQLKQMYDLIVSIKGVGPQTALFIISYTHGFTRFKTWRQFASYCGVAPFPYQSGISIRGRTKVNNLANKKIKSLLDLCAKSSIQFNMEMKMYYEKRVKDGKSKMSTINIIRNKILSRIFATVSRGTPYVNTVAYQS
jgi:transposase